MSKVIIVWKDSTYKLVDENTSWEYESDSNWLVTIPFSEMVAKEIENLKQALDLSKTKLKVAEKSLNDIVKWDDDLEDEWGDPGECANAALEKIMILDGF